MSANNSLNTLAYPTRMTDPEGFEVTTQYNYDTSAMAKMTTPASGTAATGIKSVDVTYAYDSAGRPTRVTNVANGGCGCAGGEQVTTKDERGRQKVYSKDTFGRLVKVDELNYDDSVYSTTTYTYNALDLLTEINQAELKRTFDYDGYGRLASYTTPEQGKTDYVYFADDMVQKVTDARGVTTTVSYNARHLPTADPTGPYAENYSYDQYGNLTWRNGWGAANAQYAHNPQFQNNRIMVNPVTGKPMTYDATGNLTSDGDQLYTYNAQGQQAAINGTSLTQSYDGDGLRVKKTEGRGDDLLPALQRAGRPGRPGGRRRRALHGADAARVRLPRGADAGRAGERSTPVPAENVLWVHQDPVTKSQRLTEQDGDVVSWVDMDPWGGETGRSSFQEKQTHRYTSYLRDSDGGDDAMFRRYESKWARFVQPDPYEGSYDLTQPQSLNRYAYVHNDPVNFVDPRGLQETPTNQGPTSFTIPYSVDEQECRDQVKEVFGP